MPPPSARAPTAPDRATSSPRATDTPRACSPSPRSTRNTAPRAASPRPLPPNRRHRLGAHVHAQLEVHVDAAAAGDRLMHAGHLAGRALEGLRHDLAVGDDRIALLL